VGGDITCARGVTVAVMISGRNDGVALSRATPRLPPSRGMCSMVAAHGDSTWRWYGSRLSMGVRLAWYASISLWRRWRHVVGTAVYYRAWTDNDEEWRGDKRRASVFRYDGDLVTRHICVWQMG